VSNRLVGWIGRVALAASLVLGGILTWVLVDPQHWFPDAYAQQGDRGPTGPAGPPGPQGPPGPVGPDAEAAVDDLSSRVDDLESSLSDLSDHVGGTTLEGDVDQLRDDVDAVQQTVSDLCDAFINSDNVSLNDVNAYLLVVAHVGRPEPICVGGHVAGSVDNGVRDPSSFGGIESPPERDAVSGRGEHPQSGNWLTRATRCAVVCGRGPKKSAMAERATRQAQRRRLAS
jgi:hypothetical protein